MIEIFQERSRLSQEGQLLDKKSLRSVTGKTADGNASVKRVLYDLIEKGDMRFEDEKRWRRFWAKP